MEEEAKDAIFEEREELMVSPAGGIPIRRTGYFLRPTVSTIDGPTIRLPSVPSSPAPIWQLKVTFNGWRDPLRQWKNWVNRMSSKHRDVWIDAGIGQAVLCSVYKIRRNEDLIFGISERWCPETKTFLFPWGESTITLEDMMILGGFSVLGSPVFLHPQTAKSMEVEEHLSKTMEELKKKSRAHRANHCEWIKHFMENDTGFEHEAFLSLWLSRFVFPTTNTNDLIDKRLFPIATLLAAGLRVALAPAVLATIYRDLSLLKEALSCAHELGKGRFLAIAIAAPMRLVQAWAWERLLPLKPKPKSINSGEPRFARWNIITTTKTENIRTVIDNSGDFFEWRPYTRAIPNWVWPKFYPEEEKSINFDHGLDHEFESFTRCLRSSELVGLDCVEIYLPHRVSMQFGLDQDLPKWVFRSNETREIAWINYIKPIFDGKLFVPTRLSESDVTVRYVNWWKHSVSARKDVNECVVRRKRNPRRSKKLADVCEGKKMGVESVDFSPGFERRERTMEGKGNGNGEGNGVSFTDFPLGFGRNENPLGEKSYGKGASDGVDFPPGFERKENSTEVKGNGNGEKNDVNFTDFPPGFGRNENPLGEESEGKGASDSVDFPRGFGRRESTTERKGNENGEENDVDFAGFPFSLERNENSSEEKSNGNEVNNVNFPLSFKRNESTMEWETSEKGVNSVNFPLDLERSGSTTEGKGNGNGEENDVVFIDFPSDLERNENTSEGKSNRKGVNSVNFPPDFEPRESTREGKGNENERESDLGFADFPPGFERNEKSSEGKSNENENEKRKGNDLDFFDFPPRFERKRSKLKAKSSPNEEESQNIGVVNANNIDSRGFRMIKELEKPLSKTDGRTIKILWLELEERISKAKKMMNQLESAKFSNRFFPKPA